MRRTCPPLLLLLAAALLGACTDHPADRPAATSADSPPGDTAASARADAPDAPLQYLRYAAELSAERPLQCLTFSAPLDPTIDYSAYVAIDAQVALAVEGERLCLGGLGFGESHALTLRAGLPAADGRRLAADVRETLSFADRPAVVRFAGGGVILPRIDADGVALETVNVATLRITVSRVNDRALAFRSISRGFEAVSGEYAWQPRETRADDVARELWRGEMDTPGPANAAVTTVFPLVEVLGELEPGAYVIRAENLAELESDHDRPVARAERWLVVTDLAFTAYRARDGLDVVLRSLQTAQPVRNARVQLVARSNEILAETTSSRDGRTRFAGALLRGQGPNAPRLLLAYGADGDFAVLDLDRSAVDLSDHPVSGRVRGAVDSYLYLDRGVYRPGETVQASALLRDATGRALTERPAALVLFTPSGLEYSRVRFQRAAQAGGVFHAFELPGNAARGQWRLTLEVDGVGEVARRGLAVEDFVPQRIELALAADTSRPLGRDERRAVQADARFLYGAPGSALPVTTLTRLQLDPQPFADYPGFQFGRHDEAFSERLDELPATLTDDAGQAVVEVAGHPETDAWTQALRLRVLVSATEPGGRAVTRALELPYRPRGRYVGLRPALTEGRGEANRPVEVAVVALDTTGTALEASLDWQLLRNDWQYDWYRSEWGEWQWRRSRRVVPIEDGRLELAADSAQLRTPALDWGDYTLVLRADGELVASTGFQVGWAGATDGDVTAPDRVRIAGPARAPRVGERAELTIVAPYAGTAEVVVATDRVLESLSVDVPAEGARVSVPVTADWGAGAHVMVSVYTPREARRQPQPRRAVGVAHVPVDLAADGRTFELAVSTPGEVVRPNQPLSLEVHAQGLPSDERAWLTLAAVDEGILQLTGFASPDPVEWFFGRTALGVELLDDYGRLLDPNQGRAAAVRSGGDGELGGEGLVAVPFRTVALFSGPVALDAAGRGRLNLELPDFNGELRLMAVAWSQAGLAATSRSLTVRDAVPATLVLPRFLAPGDEARATLSLDNVEGAAGDYLVSLGADRALTLGVETLSLALDRGERGDRPIPLTAREEGVAEVSLGVLGPDGFAVARGWPLQVRPAWLPASRVYRARLAPGEQLAVPATLMAGFPTETATLQVSFTATPIDVAAIYRALADYPHGCSEQRVSRVLPLLYAGQLAGLGAVTPPARAEEEIRAAIETLLARQDRDGAFGLWRVGDAGASPWLGAYLTDFLARAAEAGHSVPAAALERAYAALQPIAQGDRWRIMGYDTQVPEARLTADTRDRLAHRSAAYASYVLARAGRMDRSRLRYLHDELLPKIESPLARAHVGAALASLGDRARAVSAFAAAVEALEYRNPGDVYQSPLRDLAGVLALAAEAGVDDHIEPLLERLGERLPEPTRLNVQEQVFVLLAARALTGGATDLSMVDQTGAALEPVFTLSADALEAGPVFVNRGSGPAWTTLLARGSAVEAPPAAAEGLTVDKQLRDLAGRPVATAEVRQGDRLVISLDVSSRQAALSQVALVDLLPAGLEIEAVLTPADAGEQGRFAWLGTLAPTRSAEARDDRFIAALDLRGGETYRVAYLVRAVTPGRFALPGAVAEDMYRPARFARSATGELTISP